MCLLELKHLLLQNCPDKGEASAVLPLQPSCRAMSAFLAPSFVFLTEMEIRIAQNAHMTAESRNAWHDGGSVWGLRDAAYLRRLEFANFDIFCK